MGIGRYENPYVVAEWHRDPPPGTECKPYTLFTEDRAIAHGWLYHRGGEDTVVCLMHPRANFSRHYLTPALVEAGFAVFCENSRWLNNDATLIHERVLLDVAAGVRAMRERFDRVVLCGNSGGGSLYTFYQSQANAGSGERLSETASGEQLDLNRFEMPCADAMIYLAAHPGEGYFLLHAIDASVLNENDPTSCNPRLDLYDPANGFREPPQPARYGSAFLAAYRTAQRARIERLDACAREHVARRRAARERAARGGGVEERRRAIATSFLAVYRTEADPRYVDLSLDASKRGYGSLWSVRPDLSNYGAFGFSRVVSPEAWLSTWSAISSRAEITKTGPSMTLPSLMVTYSGDNVIFPSDNALMERALGSAALGRVELDADHYGFPVESGREAAAAEIAAWLRR
jgi:hypothetical protein